ncbi:hypothetical protein APW00_12370, partial [Staphylococcus aureus]
NKCCKLKNAHCAGCGLSFTSSTGFTVRSNISSFCIIFISSDNKKIGNNVIDSTKIPNNIN